MCWLEFVMRWIEAVYEKPLAATDSKLPPESSKFHARRPPDSAIRPPDAHDWYAPLPEIPPMFRAEPAVLEAELVVQGRSIAHFIADDRTVR